MKKVLYIILAFALLCSCAQKQKPKVVSTLLGVPEYLVEEHIVECITRAQGLSLPDGQKEIEYLFDRINSEEESDTTKHAYIRLTEIVCNYLYDPNSPLRDEDLYYSFLKKMIDSPHTSKDILPAYKYEMSVCALNPRESQASDFVFKTPDGKLLRLYDIKAGHTILFFSNPGCQACKDIIQTIESAQFLEEMISKGELSIVNVYVDRELDEWRAYLDNYPTSWINGYDPNYVIREDVLYNLRAIPSVYLLDEDKTVLLKDADIVKVINYLYTLNQY